jgi:ubiquinone/menaquinone biosynthesis C-methylase UbiE
MSKKDEKYKETQNNFYSEVGQKYKSYFKKYFEKDKKILYPYINLLKEKLDNPCVLEIGPGSGLALYYFEKEGIKTFAIDISSEIIDVSKSHSKNTNFFKGDFLEFDFKDKKFDGIFAKSVFHLFPKNKLETTFEKTKLLLKKGGLIYISISIYKKSEEGLFERKDLSDSSKQFRAHWTENEFKSIVEKCGLKIVKEIHNDENERERKWLCLILKK